MEEIQKMLSAFEDDQSLAGELEPLLQSGDAAGIVAVAAKHGFHFTEADWQAYRDWSEKLPAAPKGKELSQEELEKVSGGIDPGGDAKGPIGTISNPLYSGCWFYPVGEAEFRDGKMRKRCKQFLCKTYCFGDESGWFICGCWGCSKCVNAWHEDIGDCKGFHSNFNR